MTDSLKVWYILRKRAIFYREFSIGREVFGGGGVDFSSKILHGVNLAEFKYKLAHSPHDK